MIIRSKLLSAVAVAAVAALSVTAAFADSSTLTTGDVSMVDHWYGRAGGLVGAQRIAALQPNDSNPGITVTYDRAVAERTNMAVDRSTGQGVTVTYDREVAARTNMARSHDSQPVQAAEVPGTRSN
jgi:hypothetical protein